MRRVREILRLKHACGASDRAIVRSLGAARSTVALTLERLAAAGLVWSLPETLSERVLEAMLYAGRSSKQGFRRKAEPGWTHVHRELRRPGVTLMLLWEEYRAAAPDGYAYSRWCELYRAWEGRLSPTMRQAHPAGERLFVDYAGQTVEIVDGRTGEVREAQVFVAALGASSYTYAEATWTQSLPALGRQKAPAPSETEPPAAAGSGPIRGLSPSWAACRRSSSRTTRRSASSVPTGTSRG